jgi:aspartyl-tRNA(Asn)/glutamyl-tRNA(Gln) amidotransferase subunit B
MNSFRNVERAIDFEIKRQIELVEDGGEVIQQTLLWNADLNEAFPMRGKEESHDYRYFPDPDLVPVVVDEVWKSELEKRLPELPQKRKVRFVTEYGIPEYDSEVLTSEKEIANYFEETTKTTKNYKSASNWIMVDVLKVIKDEKISITDFTLSPENLGKLINLIDNNIISGKIAKEVFPEMLKSNVDPEIIVKEKGLIQITDTAEIEKAIEEIISHNEKQVEEYRSGKDKVFGFFVGQVMRATKGKANPQIVNDLLKQKLS